MDNKVSEQFCIHCGHERKHCHPISGKCFYDYEPPYTNPGCGCKCSFSEAAASEGVPEQGISREEALRLASEAERPILEIIFNNIGTIRTNRSALKAAREIVRVRASVDKATIWKLAQEITYFADGHRYTDCPEHWTKSVFDIIEAELRGK